MNISQSSSSNYEWFSLSQSGGGEDLIALSLFQTAYEDVASAQSSRSGTPGVNISVLDEALPVETNSELVPTDVLQNQTQFDGNSSSTNQNVHYVSALAGLLPEITIIMDGGSAILPGHETSDSAASHDPDISEGLMHLIDGFPEATGHRIILLLTSSTNRVAINELNQLVANYGSPAVGNLLGLLASEDPSMRETGEELLSMLSQPNADNAGSGLSDSQLAILLLSELWLNSNDIASLMEMHANPDQRNVADALLQLMYPREQTQVSEQDALAARNILSMVASDDPSIAQSGQHLLRMLTSSEQSERQKSLRIAGSGIQQNYAFGLVSGLSTVQIHRLLAISDDPRQQLAAHNLDQMLNSTNPAAQQSARNLLEMLDSSDALERSDGLTLLSMLNRQATASRARQILQTSDLDLQHSLVTLSENSQIEEEVLNTMFSLMELGRPAEEAFAERLVELHAHPQNSQPQAELLQGIERLLLGQDPLSLSNADVLHSAGRTIINHLQDPERTTMLSLLNSPSTRQGSLRLLAMLDSGGAERPAAIRYLAWRQQHHGNNNESDPMLAMLADTDSHQTAINLINSLSSNALDQLSDRIDQNPNHLIFNLVTSGFPSERQVGNRLLQLLAGQLSPQDTIQSTREAAQSTQEPARSVGTRLLVMLENQEQRETAKQILRSSLEPNAIQNLLNLYGAEPTRADALRLLEMINQGDTATVSGLLSQLTQPAGLHTALDLLATPGNSSFPRMVREMLAEGGGSVQRLVNLLNAPEGSQERVNGRALLSSLDGDDWIWARAILGSEQASRNAHVLIAAINTGGGEQTTAAQILDGLSSENTETRQTAVNRLASLAAGHRPESENQVAADRIHSTCESPVQCQSLLNILADRFRYPHASQWLQNMAAIPTQASDNAIRNLASLLSTGDGAIGQQLLTMLNDPQRQSEARNILSRLNSATQVRTLMQLQSEGHGAATAILEMINSPNESLWTGANSVLSFVARSQNPQPSSRGVRPVAQSDILLERLADPQTRDLYQEVIANSDNINLINTFGLMGNTSHPIAMQTIHSWLAPGMTPEMVAHQLGSLSPMDAIANIAGNLAARPEQARNHHRFHNLSQLNPAAAQQVLELLNDPQQVQIAERILDLKFDSATPIQSLVALSSNPSERNNLLLILDSLEAEERTATGNSGRDESAMEIASLISQASTPGPLNQLTVVPLISESNPASIRNQIIRDAVEQISDLQGIGNLISVLDCPELREGVERLLSILADPDQNKSSAQTIMRMLCNPASEAVQQAAERLIGMIGGGVLEDEQTALRLGAAFVFNPGNIVPLLAMMDHPEHRNGVASILRILEGTDSDLVNRTNQFLANLGSPNPSVREEAERIRHLFSTGQYDSAVRMLGRLTRSQEDPAELRSRLLNPN